EPLGAGLLAPARGQPGRVPVAARRGVARGHGLRVALPAALVLDPAAVLARALGLDDLPAPPLRGRPAGGGAASAARGRARAAARRMVVAPAASLRLRRGSGRALKGCGTRGRCAPSPGGTFGKERRYFEGVMSTDQLRSPHDRVRTAASLFGFRSIVKFSTAA